MVLSALHRTCPCQGHHWPHHQIERYFLSSHIIWFVISAWQNHLFLLEVLHLSFQISTHSWFPSVSPFLLFFVSSACSFSSLPAEGNVSPWISSCFCFTVSPVALLSGLTAKNPHLFTNHFQSYSSSLGLFPEHLIWYLIAYMSVWWHLTPTIYEAEFLVVPVPPAIFLELGNDSVFSCSGQNLEVILDFSFLSHPVGCQQVI